VPLTRKTKQEILDELIMRPEPIEGDTDLISFLNRIWPLDEMPSEDGRFRTASGDIHKHMVMNDDWTIEELYARRLGLLNAEDDVFGRFLESYVHPLVRRDPTARANAAAAINRVLGQTGLQLVQTGSIDDPRFELSGGAGGYEVVLSFAGEQRGYVERVAEMMRSHGVTCFYDSYEAHTLWGKNLVEHLQQVYGGTARFCIMFVSQDYAEKVWPNHERRSAFDAAIQRRVEYILPVRFDNTVVPGLSPSVHYLKASDYQPNELATVLLRKLGRRSPSWLVNLRILHLSY
jgi:hypothetical protein